MNIDQQAHTTPYIHIQIHAYSVFTRIVLSGFRNEREKKKTSVGTITILSRKLCQDDLPIANIFLCKVYTAVEASMARSIRTSPLVGTCTG